jgi:hypothetical protein
VKKHLWGGYSPHLRCILSIDAWILAETPEDVRLGSAIDGQKNPG